MRDLISRFYAGYDRSAIESFITSRNYVDKLLGRGSHFAAYRFNTTSFSYAVKISESEIDRNNALDLEGLFENLRYLQGLQLSLVPPMETFALDDRLVIVQPLVETMLNEKSEHWRAYQVALDKFYDDLDTSGFKIADKIQGGVTMNTPFIYDFSDLKRTASV